MEIKSVDDVNVPAGLTVKVTQDYLIFDPGSNTI
jgi:hypothetical protein